MEDSQETQFISDFELVRTLGQGSSGKVKLAVQRETGMQVAIKIIKKSAFRRGDNLQLKIRREIALMHITDHPHLLKLLDVYESPRHLYMIMEYASKGELFDYLVKHTSLKEDVAMRFFRQIIFGLEYLHNMGICHRDLKPENILLDDHLNIKIADFGFARFIQSNIAETSCGSPHYAAPEVIRGQPYEGKKADIWSCGVILYALLAGYLPFEDYNIRNLLAKVKRGVFIMPNHFSPGIKAMISGMIQVDPAARLTIPQIKQMDAFWIGLNRDYTLPKPPPLPNFNDPIPEESLKQWVVDLLFKIGYPDKDELLKELTSPGPAQSKVFYKMIVTRILIDQINWEDEDDSVAVSPDILISSPPPQAYVAGVGPFHRYAQGVPGTSGPGSIGPQSLAVKPEWAAQISDVSNKSAIATPGEVKADGDAEKFAEPYETQTIEIDNMELSEIMLCFQRTADQCLMKWIHPDDFTLLTRSYDHHTYIEVKAEYLPSSETGFLITLYLWNGTQESSDLFTNFITCIQTYLENFAGGKEFT